jgi:Ca2+-binding RTX toxin-like protein
MFSPSARKRLGWVGCALALAAGAFAAVAVSGAAEQRGGELTIDGDSESITVRGSEARNVVTFERVSGEDTITITGGSFDEQHPDCEGPLNGPILCDSPSFVELLALLRDGNDTLAFLGGGLKTLTISGITGPGDDKLLSKKGSQFLQGGTGEDNLNAGLGDDELRGGPNPDVLLGGHGEDTCDDSPQDTRVKGCEN